MIDPKRLTEADKGREVAYKTILGQYEYGHISSWTEHFIFVRYGTSDTAAATRAEDLTFTLGTYQDGGTE